MSDKVIALTREETRGEWVLWCFTVEPRTLRYVWVRNGCFPMELFSEEAVRNKLSKTLDTALDQKDKWEKLSDSKMRGRR